jgi:hypothetical protein
MREEQEKDKYKKDREQLRKMHEGLRKNKLDQLMGAEYQVQ